MHLFRRFRRRRTQTPLGVIAGDRGLYVTARLNPGVEIPELSTAVHSLDWRLKRDEHGRLVTDYFEAE